MAYGTVKTDTITYDNSGSDASITASTIVTTTANVSAATKTNIFAGNNTFTGLQTLNGTSSSLAAVLKNTAEPVTIVASGVPSTLNYDTTTQNVIYYTSNCSANFTVNFRASSGTSLNAIMSTGQVITCILITTQGGTAYYNNTTQIDGTSVTPKWQTATVSSGNANRTDIYAYTIIKTGDAAFTLLVSQSPFQ
tara:strand:- start:653 stop:1234 length:582 start_codon:yes stop_codon:yes gene_type:complete